ncbi:MAG: hypothetical protein HWE22_07760 [Flavobacteriales bacterium]|nr:hypothetical protein [Flavobacteriales bacterium]
MKVFALLISFVLLVGCHSSNRTEISDKVEPTYFEGEIYYSISYDLVPSYLSEESLKSTLGAKMVLIYKNGNHRKEIYSSNGDLISTRYLDLSQNKSFSFDEKDSTITWFDIRKPDTQLTFSSLNDTLVENEKCLILKTTFLTPNPRNKSENFEVKSTFINSQKLAVNPDWFKEYLEGNFNELIKKTQSLSIEIHTYGPFWNTKQIADSIIWRKVDDKELKVPKIKGQKMIEL